MTDESNISTDSSNLYIANNSANALHLFTPPRATCPTHGEVDGGFHVSALDSSDTITGKRHQSPPLCPKCFVDFIASNVTHVTPLPAPTSGPPEQHP